MSTDRDICKKIELAIINNVILYMDIEDEWLEHIQVYTIISELKSLEIIRF